MEASDEFGPVDIVVIAFPADAKVIRADAQTNSEA